MSKTETNRNLFCTQLWGNWLSNNIEFGFKYRTMCGWDVNRIGLVWSFDNWTNVWQFLDKKKCFQILDYLIKTTHLHFCTQKETEATNLIPECFKQATEFNLHIYRKCLLSWLSEVFKQLREPNELLRSCFQIRLTSVRF
jgi:hypothetical protein